LPLFINLSKLLKPNGVLITIFANHALHLITNKRGPNQFIYNIKYKKNMDREYKKHYLQNLRNIQQEHIVNKIMRRKLKMFLINNKLPLNLLSLQSNKKYVRSAIWYSRVDDFFIMKKML
jgi:transcriptional regulator CtsR